MGGIDGEIEMGRMIDLLFCSKRIFWTYMCSGDDIVYKKAGGLKFFRVPNLPCKALSL